MRLIACGLSAVLLSGCSWLGGVGNMLGGGSHQAANQAGQYGAQGAYNQPRANPCEIPAANHPIPRGCHPSQVTVGTGGFAQQPNFGAGGQYAGAGYGSHAADAQAHAAHRGQRAPKLRKPRFRASLAYGVEKSKGGNLLDYADVTFDPVGGYNPQDYNEGTTTGSIANGSTTAITYTANDRNPPGDNIFAPNSYEEAIRPDVSFDDAHHAPTKLTLGGEYILNKNTTLFGQVGYLHGAGEVGDAAVVNATLYRHQQTTNYDDTGAITSVDAPVVAFMPNETIARFQYDFSDTERYDMEVGARRYFTPIWSDGTHKTVTPFVAASAGASYHKGVSYEVQQTQSFYERTFNDNGTADPEDLVYNVTGPQQRVDLYDSQWVPTGQLNAGVDWQVTPKTSLAFETGVRVEGARDYSNGNKGDTNVIVPFTLRGSYNF